MIIRTYETTWEVELTSGKRIKENMPSFDLIRGTRRVDWALDLVSSGDIKKIKMLYLHTPKGTQWIEIREPGTAFQLKRGTQMFFGDGGNSPNCHIIGRVDDKESGNCTAIIYDYHTKEVYQIGTNIHDFGVWRSGVLPIGSLQLEVIGVSL